MKPCKGIPLEPCPYQAMIPTGKGLRCRDCARAANRKQAKIWHKKYGQLRDELRRNAEAEAKKRVRHIEPDEAVFSPLYAEKLINKAINLS